MNDKNFNRAARGMGCAIFVMCFFGIMTVIGLALYLASDPHGTAQGLGQLGGDVMAGFNQGARK